MAEYSLNPLNISPAEFLRAFFQPHEIICLRILPDKKDTVFSEQKLETVATHIEKLLPLLEEHNKQERGVFFVVNFGGHDGKNIRRINAQFVDIDHGTLEEQLASVKAFSLEPSLIVRTKRGLHCYWLMKNAVVERYSLIQKQLVRQFDGDPNCVDLPRVLRVPGFYHHKEEPQMVACIKFNPELRYTQEQLSPLLPEIPESESAVGDDSLVKDRGTQQGLVQVGKRCAFIQHCKKNAKTLSEPDWYAMITNLALFDGGESVIHKLSRPYPNYSAEATQKKINHFHESGTKPMTCSKIFEQGFRCPRADNCPAKSPAGLAFFSLDAVALPKALSTVKVKHDPVLDVEAARTFIKDYLYNIDTGIAEVFIHNNIREHFGFKTTDIKSLPAFHKELYRHYASLREVKSDKYKEKLSAWYEFNSRGELRFMPGVLADFCANNEDIIYVGESYYFYESGVFMPRNDMAAECHIRNHMQRDRFKTTAQIKDAEHQWRIQIDKPVTEINPNAYLINLQNTMCNVQTDELIEHDPKYMSTIQIHARYNPGAECPIFLNYLKGVLPETEHPLIQEILGYVLIAVNKAQKSTKKLPTCW